MEELQLTLTPARVDQRNFGIMLSNWRVGQALNAMVVDTQPNGGVLLSVGGKQFVATTDLPVQAGMRLALEVKQMGQEIVLKASPQQAAAVADPAAAKANSLLSTPTTTPASLLTTLQALPQRMSTPEVSQAARDLMGRAINGPEVKPSDVKRGFLNSGIFTEAQLSAGQMGAAKQSPKASLQKLQNAAIAMLADVDGDSEEAAKISQVRDRASALLSGISSQQVASLPQDDGTQRWLATMPMELKGQFHDAKMQIEREAPGPGEVESQAPWRVTIDLDLPELGAVEVTLGMRGQAVSVDFNCDDPKSAHLIERGLPRLEQRLIARELRVAELSAEAPQETASVDDRPPSGSGFEVEA